MKTKVTGEVEIPVGGSLADIEKYIESLLHEQKQHWIKEVLKKVKLINDILNEVVCECGEPYKNCTPHYLIRELIKSLQEESKE